MLTPLAIRRTRAQHPQPAFREGVLEIELPGYSIVTAVIDIAVN